MARSTFSGPIYVGTAQYGATASMGRPQLSQSYTWDVPNLDFLSPNGTNTALTTAAGTFDSIMYLPAASRIIDIYADIDVVYNQGTSAVISMGSAAAGTQYVTSIDIKAAIGRVRPTFSAAQWQALVSTVANATATTANGGVPTSAIYARITSVGTAASTGHGYLTVIYQ